MARGRMISRSLSTSERRAALHQEAGKLAEFCQSLYPLLVAHADDYGRQQGDVFTIKHAVDPSSPRRLQDFDAALRHLHNVRLIEWYEVDGKWVVQIVNFESHQHLSKKAQKSKFPESPGTPGIFQNPPLKGTELKRTEQNRKGGAENTAPSVVEIDEDLGDGGITGKDVHGFIRRFCELYSKHRHGARYFVKAKQHVPLVKQLLRIFDAQRLEKMAVVLLTTDQDWVKDTDRGIGILSVKASWLDGLLAEYEAKHGEIRVAS